MTGGYECYFLVIRTGCQWNDYLEVWVLQIPSCMTDSKNGERPGVYEANVDGWIGYVLIKKTGMDLEMAGYGLVFAQKHCRKGQDQDPQTRGG